MPSGINSATYSICIIMDEERIKKLVRELLIEVGEDPTREGLTKTPERIANAYKGFFMAAGHFGVSPTESDQAVDAVWISRYTHGCTITNNAKSTSAAGHEFQVFRRNSSQVGSITQANSTDGTNYGSNSDYRLKENVDYSWDATTRLKQLKPCRFNWISDETNTLQDGFIAHEVSSIVPEAISGEKDATEVFDDLSGADPITRAKYQTSDNAKLVPLLVKTVQELEARIAVLEG